MKANKVSKDKIMVIVVGVIALIVMGVFIYINIFPETDQENTGPDTQKVSVKGSDEANFMNLSVPKASVEKDSLSVVDKIEKIKQDSIEQVKENTKSKEVLKDGSLIEYERMVKKKTVNNDYSSGRSIRNSNEYNNDASVSIKRKKTVSNRTEKVSSANYEDESSFFSNSKSSVTTSNDANSISNAVTPVINEDLPTDKKIYACIHNDQTIKDNSRIKIRLTKKTVIDGISYPTNTIIYGLAKLQQNRMYIEITSVNQNKVSNLEVFDAEDSNKGIYVETPILNASLKKEIGNDALQEDIQQNIPFSRTLSSFLQKKLKEEKIELLNNYKLIIKKKVE